MPPPHHTTPHHTTPHHTTPHHTTPHHTTPHHTTPPTLAITNQATHPPTQPPTQPPARPPARPHVHHPPRRSIPCRLNYSSGIIATNMAQDPRAIRKPILNMLITRLDNNSVELRTVRMKSGEYIICHPRTPRTGLRLCTCHRSRHASTTTQKEKSSGATRHTRHVNYFAHMPNYPRCAAFNTLWCVNAATTKHTGAYTHARAHAHTMLDFPKS
jgi:hypothetical protein